MRNQLQTWFLEGDEKAFSQHLRLHHPTVFFVDYDDASSPDVEMHLSTLQCSSGVVTIWDSQTECPGEAAELWVQSVKNKSVDATAQFHRSRKVTDDLVNCEIAEILKSGRVAAKYRGKGTPAEIQLKKQVYEAVKAVSTSDIVQVSPTTREILESRKVPGARCGEAAAKWCREKLHLLQFATVTTFFLPRSVVT